MARQFNLARWRETVLLTTGTGGNKSYSNVLARSQYNGTVCIHNDGGNAFQFFQVRDQDGTLAVNTGLPALPVLFVKNWPGTDLWFVFVRNNTGASVNISLSGGGTVAVPNRALAIYRMNESGQTEAAWSTATLGSTSVDDWDFDLNASGIGYIAATFSNGGSQSVATYRLDVSGAISLLASTTQTRVAFGHLPLLRNLGRHGLAVSSGGRAVMSVQRNVSPFRNGYAVDTAEDGSFSTVSLYTGTENPQRVIRCGTRVVAWAVTTPPQVVSIDLTTAARTGLVGHSSSDGTGIPTFTQPSNTHPLLIALGSDKIAVVRIMTNVDSWTTANFTGGQTGDTVVFTQPSLNAGQSYWSRVVGTVWNVDTGALLNTFGGFFGTKTATTNPQSYGWEMNTSYPDGEDFPRLCGVFRWWFSNAGDTDGWIDMYPGAIYHLTSTASTDPAFTVYGFPTMLGLHP